MSSGALACLLVSGEPFWHCARKSSCTSWETSVGCRYYCLGFLLAMTTWKNVKLIWNEPESGKKLLVILSKVNKLNWWQYVCHHNYHLLRLFSMSSIRLFFFIQHNWQWSVATVPQKAKRCNCQIWTKTDKWLLWGGVHVNRIVPLFYRWSQQHISECCG